MSGFDEKKKFMSSLAPHEALYSAVASKAYNAGDENGYRRGVEDAAKLIENKRHYGAKFAKDIRKLLTRG